MPGNEARILNRPGDRRLHRPDIGHGRDTRVEEALCQFRDTVSRRGDHPKIGRRQGVERADLVDDTAIDRIGEAACVKIDADDVPALVPQRKAHGSSDEAHTDDHGLFGVSHDNAGYRGGSEPVAGFSDADATSSDRTSSASQFPPLPRRQTRIGDRPDPSAHKSHDRMADRIAHSTNLPVPSFV